MRCPHCHQHNPDDTFFCGKCGGKLAQQEDEHITKTVIEERSIPRRIIAGKYKLVRELGRGGMGVVYEAEDVKLKRRVALKFLPQELTRDREARERFVHEAQAASQLDHTNICTVHEIGEDLERMFIAMACYHGESLKIKIRNGPIPLDKAVGFFRQACEGMAKAHAMGVVHRDIKPANILITEDETVKIVDFGLAKLGDQTKITRSGTTMGTAAYMSPEQARGDEVDQRTDVWSLGVVLYEMLTGELPFRGAKETAVVYSILNEKPVPLDAGRTRLPFELEEIVKKTLEKDPERRYASAGELAEAVGRVQLQLSSGMPVESIRQRKRRTVKYVLAGTAAGMVLFALLLVLWALTRPGLAFNEHDRLLVADVDNQTGDEVFDLALKTAIEADLQQSPYARVFDKGQVAETLRLMKLNPSSRIDEQLGYDICRFAGIRALILPRILAAGEAYELHAIIIDPARERHVDRIRVRAQSREEVLLKAIDSLSSRLRSQLGESMASIQEADKTIAQVTTSSWEALQYLSLGLEKWHEAKYKDSAVFLELALDKDPHFASARSTLGLLLIQWLDQKEKGKEMLNQALADAEDISQKELLLIKAVHREFVEEDFDGALAEYRLITELFPDTMQAYNNSGMILRSLGRVDEAVVMYEKAAVVAPRNTVPLSNLYWTHLFFRKDPQAAEDAARRAVNLGPETALLQHMLGYTLAAQARFEEAAAAYKKCLEIEPRHPYGLPNLAYILLAMGRAGEAIPLYEDIHELIREGRLRGYLPLASFDLAYALLQAGDPAAAREAAGEGLKDLEAKTENVSRQAWVPLLTAKLELAGGSRENVDRYLEQAFSFGPIDTGAKVYLAEIYALTDQPEKALETLSEVLESGYSDPFYLLIYPAFQSIRKDPRFRALIK